jgi:hypothetical protein
VPHLQVGEEAVATIHNTGPHEKASKWAPGKRRLKIWERWSLCSPGRLGRPLSQAACYISKTTLQLSFVSRYGSGQFSVSTFLRGHPHWSTLKGTSWQKHPLLGPEETLPLLQRFGDLSRRFIFHPATAPPVDFCCPRREEQEARMVHPDGDIF